MKRVFDCRQNNDKLMGFCFIFFFDYCFGIFSGRPNRGRESLYVIFLFSRFGRSNFAGKKKSKLSLVFVFKIAS